jgi:hypothetical protein
MNYGYIGPTPITEYGCVKCQKYHRLGIDAWYDDHLYFQSKHGIRERAPIGKGEEFIAHMLADKES